MHRLFLASSLAIAASTAHAQQVVSVDASAPIAAPERDYLRLGSATAPDGAVLGIDSQSLTYNGKPWMPVMGEMHFVRVPEVEWDETLAKVKASGVDVVATYLFWNYHEETPGKFDWAGNRDLRRFVDLAAKKGLKVVLRLGPWSHGEVRFGAQPDWIVGSVPLRGSDPDYMRYVERYWTQIHEQVKGLFWKDGGPIIGVQLENEYNLNGPLQGRQHIADLKALALRLGFDVPYYTVTGWDGAVYPHREVVPVFGGYPDEPWGNTADRLPPKETYVFRFDSRVSGNLGAQTVGGHGDADPDIPHTPFLGAEYAGGVPTMYRRRPVLDPRDIAAMLPTQLGSGVNLYGYYMYVGGRNLIGNTTLEETTATGGYNDLPIIDYDFQAPIGGYGQFNAVSDYIRPFHYLIASYGDQMVPMTVRKPGVVPSANDDLKTLRWSVRSDGRSGFLFVNNYVRQYPMAAHPGTQFSVKLSGGTVTFPTRPVTVPTGAYFIWPVGLDLGGATLSWASAQPVTKLDSPEGSLHVFAATDGIAPEFAFPAGTRISGASANNVDGHVIVRIAKPGTGAMFTVENGGSKVRILVLTDSESKKLWRVPIAGQTRILLTDDQLASSDATSLALTSTGDPDFSFAIWPALPRGPKASLNIGIGKRDGIFTRYTAQAQARAPQVTFAQTRAPGDAPAIRIGGHANAAVPPYPESFGGAAGAWRVTLPKNALEGLDDAFLRIDWAGDIGRLYSGEKLVDDFFFDGRPWQIGLKRHRADLGGPLTIRVTPLRSDAPVYIDPDLLPKFGANGQVAEIRDIRIVPRYRLTVTFDR